MSNNDTPPLRRARLEDFLCDNQELGQTHNNKQKTYNHDKIMKNQQEYGHRKRIKP